MKPILALLLLPLAAAPAQEPAPVPVSEALGLVVYQPTAADPYELVDFVSELTQSKVSVVVQEAGQSPHTAFRDRFLVVGNAVLVNDTEAGRAEALALLQELDRVFAAEQARDATPEVESTVREYQPRYLGLARAQALAQSHAPEVAVEAISESRLLLLSGAESQVQRALDAFAQVDLPTPQVSLSCLFVAAPRGASDLPPAPPELAQGLAELVPGKEFRVLGAGFVRASLGEDTRLAMSGELAADHRFELEARPTAFDGDARVLSLERCQFELSRAYRQTVAVPGAEPVENFAGWRTESRFATDLALREGEYTVVGGSGSDPVFVVLRFVVQ